MRNVVLLSAFAGMLAACNNGTAPTVPTLGAALPDGALRVVGDASAGARLAPFLAADGIVASQDYRGAAAGAAAFCAGEADAVVLSESPAGTSLFSECRGNGVSWSALSGLQTDAPILYVRSEIAEDFVQRSSGYF